MSNTAAVLLLHKLRREGAVLEAKGNRIRIEAPRGVLSEGLKETVRTLKADLLDVLSSEERVLGLSLDEFQKQGWVIEAAVPWLAQTLFFVPHLEHVDLLVARGISRGRIWTAAELIDLCGIDGLSQHDARSIGAFKALFGVEIISVDAGAPASEPKAPSRCLACHGVRFWRSIHDVVVCGRCHPPASPELVAEWLGEAS